MTTDSSSTASTATPSDRAALFALPHMMQRLPYQEELDALARMDEDALVEQLLNTVQWHEGLREATVEKARSLIEQVRHNRTDDAQPFDMLMATYDLSTQEGVALMCLAEALLRIPDAQTVDDMLADKISPLDWLDQNHHQPSLFVHLTQWSLALTGKVLEGGGDGALSGFRQVVKRLGQPVIRQAVGQAMRLLGRQFVMGETITQAIRRARQDEDKHYRHSYDMLGEAARTSEDAERYFQAYLDAIDALADPEDERPIEARPSVSVKLSALHPRYEMTHADACVPVLTRRLKQLAIHARQSRIGLTVDAEEADRLDLSLIIFYAVYRSEELAGWDGLGLAVQAYQKRAMAVLKGLIESAKQHKKRIRVRLIKGAYWDTEVKDTQMRGLVDYPVFTRKANTDLHYLCCAQQMLVAGDALYCQFATHNAMSVAAILAMQAAHPTPFEFQCLHGMGQVLYDALLAQHQGQLTCRVYAPVGHHQDLLPYLVRRLLENGANSSFVHHIVDTSFAMEDMLRDPVAQVQQTTPKRHPRIPKPQDLYPNNRRNSQGLDLSHQATLKQISQGMRDAMNTAHVAGPVVSGQLSRDAAAHAVTCPADRRHTLHTLYHATPDDVERALVAARAASPGWSQRDVAERAKVLRRAADRLEERREELMALCVLEAGKIWEDAVDEVREAVDFLRYYADEAERHMAPLVCPGPTGESNILYRHGRGVMLCISPWNFPLAIFVGQVAAALACGNTVLAKPADTTVTIAAAMVNILHESGVPHDVLHLLPGGRDVVAVPLVADERIDGVMLTGSTATAKAIERNLASRPGAIVPLIAETGGQNAMIVDSTALPEQVVTDVVASAFKSAGQRCSALRVLCVQEDIADQVEAMLQGAMAELVVGNPLSLDVDVGPVIDEPALKRLQDHEAYLQTFGRLVGRCALPEETAHGTFFAPCAYVIDDIARLEGEVFGPILHIIRYAKADLEHLLDAIERTGYGLTMGIHSRVDTTVDAIIRRSKVGNTYVNRNMIGAVVGVQPFGGEGLSGTGPKAGGPNYLTRLYKERTVTINTAAIGGNASLLTLEE